MSPPDSAPLETLSLAELRELVGTLVAKVAELGAANAALKAENQALRDEVARLKGLPPRPPSRPSGMEQATGGAGPGKGGKRSRRRRGAKRDREAVTAEVVVPAAPPPGSRFKGYQDILVRELTLTPAVVRYRRERWATPSGETVLAPLPAGIVGGFGPGLRRFLLVAHAQGQVTTERLVALLAGIGIEISKRQVVRLLTSRLDDLIAEDREVLRAGLATARWVTVDDTAARHARQDGFTTQIGDGRFTAFRTGASKSRQAFLSTLRAGHGEYVINEAALDYMRGRALAGPVIELLAAHPAKVFADEAAWTAHLAGARHRPAGGHPRAGADRHRGGALGHDPGARAAARDGDRLRRCRPVPPRRARAVLGPCRAAGPQAGARQRPAAPGHRTDADPDLVAVCRPEGLAARSLPPAGRRAAGPVRPDFHPPHRLCRAGSAAGPPAPAQGRTAAGAQRPEIPLHTNGSENDIRACVTKRKVSGGTMSEDGRTARDVLLGLMKTCRKLGVSFYRYLGDRLRVPGAMPVPPLPDLVRQAAAPA